MTVRTFLDCSTAHISKSTNDMLEAGELDIYILSGECGWLIYADINEPDRLPADLAAVCAYASKIRKCDYVMLDRDAVEHDALEVYDW